MGIHFPGRELLDAARKAASIGANLVQETVGAFTARASVWKNPDAPPARAQYPLRVVSYNVLKGPQNFDAVVAQLKAQQPDVACLQEVYGKDSALRLARALGMHVAVFPNNKAILSRYPISRAENHGFDLPLTTQLADAWKSGSGEPLERRSAGIATLKVGGKSLDVIDTHLSLYSSRANASELRELDALVEAKKRAGHSVLVAGDFNTNFALARAGLARGPNGALTPTDTFEEFRARYGGKVEGNAASAEDRAAMRALLEGMSSHWDEGSRSMRLGGREWTPEAALAELDSGRVKEGSARWKALWQVVDGISHAGAGKRFDNLLASPDLAFVRTAIDADARASDHRPVLVVVSPR